MSTIYPDANCNLVNDRTDIYGLGIRIGVYLQWFALVLVYSSNLGTSERDIIRDVTYVFSGALLISLGLRNDAIWASDGFIVVCLLGSTVGLLLVLEAIDRSVACIYRKFDSVVEALRRVFLLTVSLYLVWWWFRGIDQSGTGSNCIPGYTVYLCGQRVHLQRGFRLCGRIISTIMFVIVLAASVHFLMRRHVWRYHHDEDHPSGIREGWTVTGQFRTMLGNRYVYLVGKPPPDPPRGYFGTSRRDEVWDANGTRKAKHAVFGAWFLGLVILMVILFVEMVINFQGVDGVSSVSGSGQLIPLIIGCASMVLVIYHIACREYPRDQPRNPPPAGGSYAPPANGDNPPPTGGDYPSEPVANPPPTGGDYPSDPVANPPPAVGGYPTPAEGSYARESFLLLPLFCANIVSRDQRALQRRCLNQYG
jgi:hypothetical protein